MKVRYSPPPSEADAYPDLTPGNAYRVIGIEADDLRLMNDEGQPYLYPAGPFVVVDAREPPDWETKYGEEGERYSYPAPLSAPGFFEDYFDGDRRCVAVFRQYLADACRGEGTGSIGAADKSGGGRRLTSQ